MSEPRARVFTPARRDLLVLALFVGIAALYVHPLLADLTGRIASDPGDPALNAAVLWWNATTVPFTAAWWNQPWFHPTPGITAFTENLVGLAPIATPAYWLTRDAVAAYNITVFVTFPLSAFACYFLVRRVTGRIDAAIVAGLAFAFNPYRASGELGHLQSLAAFYLPLALGALHAYLENRRVRWLFVFSIAWILQSLANGYYMLFGGVLIALWLVYFGSTARTWKAAAQAAGAWVLASLPLIPILLGYKRIHEHYGLHRTFQDAVAFSAHPDSWLQTAHIVRVWGGVLSAGKENMFPGVTAAALVTLTIVAGLSRARPGARAPRLRRVAQAAMAIAALASAAALVAFVVSGGRLGVFLGGTLLFRMSDPYRAVVVLTLCALPLLWLSPARDVLVRRHPFVFYAIATILMALFACGPVLRTHDLVILDPAPYRWLMALPGFDEIRVASRFWMMGVLCLSVSAGLGFAACAPGSRGSDWSMRVVRYALCVTASAGLLADGWLTSLPTRPAPARWTGVAGSAAGLPLLELPLGPRWDAAATLRTTTHGRRVMNGVSGYEPPHYPALEAGLVSAAPEMLAAIASLGPYEVSVEIANDPDGRWKKYVAAAPGATRVADNDARAIFRIPLAAVSDANVGLALPIQSVLASRGDPSKFIDGRMDTIWADGPQTSDQWVLADLGRPQTVGGVSLAIGGYVRDFPRHPAVEVSMDGERFSRVWEGNGAAPAFLAVLKDLRSGWLRLPVPPQEARFVRIRQLGWENVNWVVPELEINAPARR
jgi:hypothetical protein